MNFPAPSPARVSAALTALLVCTACELAPVPREPEATPIDAASTPPEPTGTLLLSVLLSADERARIDQASSRTFAYRGPLHVWSPPPAPPPVAEPEAAAGAPSVDLPLNDDGLPLPSLVGRPRAAPRASPVPRRYALLVRPPDHAVHLEVPLMLSPPGGGGGDVADVWLDGAAILRAPHYGPGTHIAMVAIDGGDVRTLAETTVEVGP